MKDKDLTEKAKEVFEKDYFAKNTVGIEIVEVRENYAKCSLELDQKHMNLGGAVMGGVLFTLADYCFGVAVNTERMSTFTVSASIDYFGSPKTKRIYGETILNKDGKNICHYDVIIKDGNDNKVAMAKFVGYHLDSRN